ncbi:PP2C family protein-serine/threonine phosphatase [Rosettibacter firmus]|uniref:PP2C family protein-serine/threonine phosphatase n=1 Tax=Rosettibacter firmus TaxID=3111522 RepID=UPI00336C0B12
MYKVDIALKSIKGKRANNQDYCIAKKLSKGVYFFAVADGMGGTVGGKIASKLVIENAIQVLNEELYNNPTLKDLKLVLERIFLTSQKAIAKKINTTPSLMGMGTTLTCILIYGNKFVWGNIGDSRIYLFRENNFSQITVDHTFVNNNKNDPALFNTQLYKNFLQRALDGGNDQPDIFPLNEDYEILEDGDIFLLCSDGLVINKSLNTTQIKEQLENAPTLKKACNYLVKYALDNNSNDNISVILVGIGNYKTKIGKNKKNRFYLIIKDKKNISNLLTILIFLSTILLIVYLTSFNTSVESEPQKSNKKIRIDTLVEKPISNNSISYNYNVDWDKFYNNQLPNLNLTEENLLKKNYSFSDTKIERNKKIHNRSSKKEKLDLKSINIKPLEKTNTFEQIKPNKLLTYGNEKSNTSMEDLQSFDNDSEFKTILQKLDNLINSKNKKKSEQLLFESIEKYRKEYDSTSDQNIRINIVNKIKILQNKAKEIRSLR